MISRQRYIEFSSENFIKISVCGLLALLSLDSDWHLNGFRSLGWGHGASSDHGRALQGLHVLVEHARESAGGSGVGHVDWDLLNWHHSWLKELIHGDVGECLILDELFESDLDFTELADTLLVDSKALDVSLVQNCVNAVLFGESLQVNFNWNRLLPELLVSNKLELCAVVDETEVVSVGLSDGELGLSSLASMASYCEVVFV